MFQTVGPSEGKLSLVLLGHSGPLQFLKIEASNWEIVQQMQKRCEPSKRVGLHGYSSGVSF
jgi:hypothetical protein